MKEFEDEISGFTVYEHYDDDEDEEDENCNNDGFSSQED